MPKYLFYLLLAAAVVALIAAGASLYCLSTVGDQPQHVRTAVGEP